MPLADAEHRLQLRQQPEEPAAEGHLHRQQVGDADDEGIEARSAWSRWRSRAAQSGTGRCRAARRCASGTYGTEGKFRWMRVDDINGKGKREPHPEQRVAKQTFAVAQHLRSARPPWERRAVRGQSTGGAGRSRCTATPDRRARGKPTHAAIWPQPHAQGTTALP